eukprot:TRINITY_DN49026_c0_g1_i1.p1 TRINITY_DN49026_c0_g1~~TRINITY_DN49026_c0_g1_i1.p1  ORF type:complete len:331 (-),score=29.49 TRINITY_DN49026_c0_g1_i1:245-1237(-)
MVADASRAVGCCLMIGAVVGTSVPVTLSGPDVSRFYRWLEHDCQVNGANNTFLANYEHDGRQVRGVGAARDIKENETFLCIPSKCWLKQGSETERAKRLTAGCSDAHSIFAIHVAEQAHLRNLSFWAPYIDMLPGEPFYRSFHPAYLMDHTLDDDTSYWDDWLEKLWKCYDGYQQQAMESAVSKDAVLLAYVRFISRGYEGVDLVPLADMLRTGQLALLNVKWSRAESSVKNVCVQAARDVVKGEELLIDHGASYLSAMYFFSVYGYAFSPADHDSELHQKPGWVDGCAGLRPSEFKEPDRQRQPILHNYWRHAQVHCAHDETGRDMNEL